MRVFVTGATGFIGRALVQKMLGSGRRVVAQVRDVDAARDQLGPEVELLSSSAGHAKLAAVLSTCDAVVNLAGENVLDAPWSAARLRALAESRVDRTRALVAAMAAAEHTPRVLISASAVGYYGDCGAELLTERAGAGEGFLPRLCRDWEDAAQAAARHGTRVVLARIGIVLGTEDGALGAMLPIFRVGLGGPLGDGKQYYPWIHVDDAVVLMERALTDRGMEGPYNLTAPSPVTMRTFATTLGHMLRRPARLRVPAMALRLALGRRASVVLQSQNAVPSRALELGHTFRFPTLDTALEDLLGSLRSVVVRNADAAQWSGAGPTPQYVLEQRSTLDAPLSEVFDFFGQARNLGLITPRWMRFRILRAPKGPLTVGSQLQYRIRLGRISLAWRTMIPRWTAPSGFTDTQLSGPYALWWHEHDFQAVGDQTHVIDRVYYRLPVGPIGRLVHALWVRGTLQSIFAYRAQAIARRFARQGIEHSPRFTARAETPPTRADSTSSV